MDIGSEVKMGQDPELGPVNVSLGSRVVPLKRRPPEDRLLYEVRTIRVLVAEIHKHLTRPPWPVRVWRRIISWVA